MDHQQQAQLEEQGWQPHDPSATGPSEGLKRPADGSHLLTPPAKQPRKGVVMSHPPNAQPTQGNPLLLELYCLSRKGGFTGGVAY